MKWTKFDILVIGTGTLWLLMILLLLAGCGLFSHSYSHSHKISELSPESSQESSYLWLGLAAVIGIGLGVGVAIALPGDDHVAYGLIGGCTTVLVVSLTIGLITTTLKWALILGIVLGLGWVGLRVWKRKSIEAVISKM
jgi:hypothetical protein